MLLINNVIFYKITKIKKILIEKADIRNINARNTNLFLLEKIEIYILNNIEIEARTEKRIIIIFLSEKFIVIIDLIERKKKL